MNYTITVKFTDGTSVTVNNKSTVAEIVGIVLAHSTKTLEDIAGVSVERVE